MSSVQIRSPAFNANPAVSRSRVTQAAVLLRDVVSGITLEKAKARVSRAAGEGKFKTNGKTRPARRLERDSFNT